MDVDTHRPGSFVVSTAAAQGIAALPGFGTVIPMVACHDMMVSEPERLAEILVGRCRRYSR